VARKSLQQGICSPFAGSLLGAGALPWQDAWVATFCFGSNAANAQ